MGAQLTSVEQAGTWLRGAGEDYLRSGLAVLNRALHAFRLVSADPDLHTVARHQALVARIGFGAGEQVADGLWTDARELVTRRPRERRAKLLAPQAHLAAVMGGRELALACQELALRARLDLAHGRDREAALQLLVALDAALAELSRDPSAPVLKDRLAELHAQREAVALASRLALAGPIDEPSRELVAFTLSRIEAALRARAVTSA